MVLTFRSFQSLVCMIALEKLLEHNNATCIDTHVKQHQEFVGAAREIAANIMPDIYANNRGRGGDTTRGTPLHWNDSRIVSEVKHLGNWSVLAKFEGKTSQPLL